jgi:hypothetical protein
MGVQNMRTVVIDASVDDYAGAINEASGLIASATGTFAAAYAAGTATVTLNGFSASKLLTAGSHIVVPGHAGYYTLSGDITATAGGVSAMTLTSKVAEVVAVPSETRRVMVEVPPVWWKTPCPSRPTRTPDSEARPPEL